MGIDLVGEVAESGSDFIDFYRETCNLVEPEMQRADFPRLINSCIDTFDYYTPEKFNSTISNNELDLNILSINVRGLATNFDNLVLYLNTFLIKFEAIILTECHIQDSIIGTQIIDHLIICTQFRAIINILC